MGEMRQREREVRERMCVHACVLDSVGSRAFAELSSSRSPDNRLFDF